jgi:ceramide glucosyltransferase
MVHQATEIIEVLAVAGTAASIAYYIVCLWSAATFLGERKAADKSVRPTLAVSILKPLRGTDPEMYESFRSHCLQDYPEYEIIFGVSDANDPAIPLVEQLQAEFPQRAIRIMICREKLGANTKVSNLAQMVRQARYEYLIVNDGDIRVEPDYLRRVLAPLAVPAVGLVTCLYRGVANSTLGSRLEALGISTDFAAGVLVAQTVEHGISFGLGSTLAFRRRDLQAIGGFEAIVDFLADDYQIGSRIAALGLTIKLSDIVVETFLPRYTLRGFVDHQLRWARAVRDSRFRGYVGLGLTFGLPWAALALICAKGAGWAWALLACAAVLRMAVAIVVGKFVLRDRQLFRWLGLFRCAIYLRCSCG